ncbi:MAG TPA: glycosyltransferase family 4 protein [Candidatus Polarisedimenticolia bacterium]|nr:glycosyltransferase family 4 protein [Candidatus Polarisedimenticolia bacterium]
MHGGGGFFISLLHESIRPLGFQSIVLSGDRGIQPGEDPAIVRLPTIKGRTSSRLSSYLYCLMAGPAMLLLRRRYDIIHTMGNAHFVYVGILLGRLLSKPVIVCSVMNRGDDPTGIVRERFGRFKNSVFSRASAYVCCSGAQVEAYRSAGYPETKVRFIPNAFQPERFHPCAAPEEKVALRERLGLPPRGFIVTTVAAITERKGIDLLVDGWILFRQSGLPGTLVLAGSFDKSDPGGCTDDAFVQSVRDRLERSGVADSVVFTGHVAKPEDYLRASDAFALMSRGEGFPLALLEGMACGLPFLIWDLPDYRGYGLKDGEQGFLLPPFEVPLLAQRLTELASSTDLCQDMGRKALTLSSRYTLDRSVEGFVALYRELSFQGKTASGLSRHSARG